MPRHLFKGQGINISDRWKDCLADANCGKAEIKGGPNQDEKRKSTDGTKVPPTAGEAEAAVTPVLKVRITINHLQLL